MHVSIWFKTRKVQSHEVNCELGNCNLSQKKLFEGEEKLNKAHPGWGAALSSWNGPRFQIAYAPKSLHRAARTGPPAQPPHFEGANHGFWSGLRVHFRALKHAGLHSLQGLAGAWMRRLRKEGSGRKFAFAKSVLLSGPGSKRTPVLEHSNSAGSGGVLVVGLGIVRHGRYHHPICRAPRRIDKCDLVALLASRPLGSRFQEIRCERMLDGTAA